MSPSPAPLSAPRGTTIGTVRRCSCGTTTPGRPSPAEDADDAGHRRGASTLTTRPSARPPAPGVLDADEHPVTVAGQGGRRSRGRRRRPRRASSVTQKAKPARFTCNRPATSWSRAGSVKRSPFVRTTAPLGLRVPSAAPRRGLARRAEPRRTQQVGDRDGRLPALDGREQPGIERALVDAQRVKRLRAGVTRRRRRPRPPTSRGPRDRRWRTA
jgi:hypothetical protein